VKKYTQVVRSCFTQDNTAPNITL